MINKNKGVTLIELLVVITIMMTMISLVAPLAINTVNKAEAQSEYLSFCGILRKVSVKAFVNGSSIAFTLSGNTLSVFKEPSRFKEVQEADMSESNLMFSEQYKYLSFTELEFKFNKNGIPNVSTILLKQKERNRELNLITLLES